MEIGSDNLDPRSVVEEEIVFRRESGISLPQTDDLNAELAKVSFKEDDPEHLPKNEHRHSKYITNHKRLSSLIEAGDRESANYPPDCYSLISLHGPSSKFFWIGFFVFAFQVAFLLFALLSVLMTNWNTDKVDDNPTDTKFGNMFPSEVGPLLRYTQLFSLVTNVVFVDASILDIVTAVHTFPNFSLATSKDRVWCMALSCFLRLTQGLVALTVSVFLIFNSPTVIDCILNFTALNFISALDDVFFEFAKSGKYGPTLAEEVNRIEELTLPVCMFRKHKHKRFYYTFIPLIMSVLACFCGIWYAQEHESIWETLHLRIEIEFSGSNSLSAFSGCYHNDMLKITDIYRRDVYEGNATNKKRGKFEFCIDEKVWYLHNGYDSHPCNVHRDNIIVRSSQTDTYDIESTFLEDWFTAEGTPADVFFFKDVNNLTALHCDASLGNGVCDGVFNNEFRNFDGGDCCASTCSGSLCGQNGLDSPFGSPNSDGFGYAQCKNDEMMVPLTIMLNNFTNSRNTSVVSDSEQFIIDNFMSDYYEEVPADVLLRLTCDSIDVLKIYVNPDMTNNCETVMVEDGADCKILIENRTNSNPSFDDDPIWYINYTIYNGKCEDSMTGDSPILLQQYSKDIGDTSFERMPKCLKKLSNHTNGKLNLNKPNGPESKAIKWMMLGESMEDASCENIVTELYALSVLNFAAPGPENNLWISEERVCTWDNIYCIGSFGKTPLDTIELDVSGLRLSGSIASELGLLNNLASYDVSKNNMIGKIPTEIGKLTGLSLLKLSGNKGLTGSIPTEIGLATSLTEIFMRSNSWTSSIPTEMGSLKQLIDLDLQDNYLTGSIPSEIGLMTLLTQLRIGGTNNLTGSIPSEIQFLKNLTILNLNNNILTGSVPSEIGLMTSLTRLSIDYNDLTGSIPSEIGLLTELTRLDIDHTDLTGLFPTEMENMQKLKTLYMENVNIPKDSLPTSLARKVAERCELCRGGPFFYHEDCIDIMEAWRAPATRERISIDECDLLQGRCTECKGESNNTASDGDETIALLLEFIQ